MKNRIPRWYYIVPVIYIALIFGFLHLHLRETGSRIIFQELGPIKVSYRQESRVRSEIRRLTVEAAGLTMDLSEGVLVTDAAGRNEQVPISDVSLEENRLVLRLSRGGTIEFAAGFRLEDRRSGSEVPGEGESENGGSAGQLGGFAVVYRREGNEATPFFPVLTFTPAQGAELSLVHQDLSLVRLETKEGVYLVVRGSGDISKDGNLIVRFDGPWLPAPCGEVLGRFSGGAASAGMENLFPGLVVAAVPEDAGSDLLDYWFFGKGQRGSEEPVEQLLDEKIDRMADFWRRGGGSDEEKVVGALAAYTLEQDGRLALDAVAGMTASAQAAGLFTTAPFIGNIVAAEQAYSLGLEKEILDQTEETDREGLKALFARNARSTSYPGLAGGLVFAGEDERLRVLASTGEALLEEGLGDSVAVAGIFIFSMEILNNYNDRYEGAADLAEKAFGALLPNMVRIGSQLMYCAHDGGKNGGGGIFIADPVLQLKLARALESYGLNGGEVLARRLGEGLLASTLSFMDENGALPMEISLENGTLTDRGERIAPELFYPYLSGRNFYPRVVSLKRELGRDLRVWTAAQGVGAVQRADGYEITFDYVPGETEFLVIRGVEPFTSLNLYGLQWNGDFRFQNYDVGGWYYDREQKKLYMKIRHNERVERIRIFE
jgi:hypothetical protein